MKTQDSFVEGLPLPYESPCQASALVLVVVTGRVDLASILFWAKF